MFLLLLQIISCSPEIFTIFAFIFTQIGCYHTYHSVISFFFRMYFKCPFGESWIKNTWDLFFSFLGVHKYFRITCFLKKISNTFTLKNVSVTVSLQYNYLILLNGVRYAVVKIAYQTQSLHTYRIT